MWVVRHDFTYSAAKKVSGAVAGLCVWVKCMVDYHAIAAEVLPKIELVAELRHEVELAQAAVRATTCESRSPNQGSTSSRPARLSKQSPDRRF
jgi:hypothetical protein